MSTPLTPRSAPVTAVRPCDEHARGGSLSPAAPHHRQVSPAAPRPPANNHQIPVTTAHWVRPQDHGRGHTPVPVHDPDRGRHRTTALFSFPTMASEVTGGETALTACLRTAAALCRG